MAKNKKISLQHKELVKFISESVMELCAKRIVNEQGTNSYIKTYPINQVHNKYDGTKQQAMESWGRLSSTVRNALKKYNIEPFRAITHSDYIRLPSEIRGYITGYLYAYKAPSDLVRNSAIAKGETLYQYIPGIKSIHLGEVQICYNIKLDRRVHCETGMALDGTHEPEGFIVSPNELVRPSIFAYEGGTMNTKYFCKQYLLGDLPIPEEVKPKVLKWMQKSWSNKLGSDLGVNKNDWYTNEKQTKEDLTEKLKDVTSFDILKLVSEYVARENQERRKEYNSGEWRMIIGDELDKEEAVPLSHEQHMKFFDQMDEFSSMLLQTNCGFGVGDKALSEAEKAVREKYGDIFAFMKEKPDNWEEMSEQEKADWLKENESKLEKETTLEQQNDAQFWWDMFSIALVVVGTVLAVVCLPCAAVGAGLVLASSAMGVASGIFDIYQGETGWGILGISLEVIPYMKVWRMSKFLKAAKVGDKEIAEMLEFSLKNGREALLTTTKWPKYSKAMYKALGENSEEMLKLLDANTKESAEFLKRFATIDAAEYYVLQSLTPAFKEAMKNIPYATFTKSIDEMSSMIFANRNIWRTMMGKAKYMIGVPMKIVAYNLTAMAVYNTWGCFDAIVRTGTWSKMMSNVLKGDVPGAAIEGLRSVSITLDPDEVQDNVGCRLIALINANIKNENRDAIEERVNDVFQEGNVELSTNSEGNTVITITDLKVDGSTEEVTILEIEETCNEVVELLGKQVLAEYKAMAGSYLNDEDILESVIFMLSTDGDMKEGEAKLESIMRGVNKGDEESVRVMLDLLDDTWKLHMDKRGEIKKRYDELLIKYKNE